MNPTEVILRCLEAGTLQRGAWTGKLPDGRETACLLAAIFPQAGLQQSSRGCPAALMPQWIADLTPWLDDRAERCRLGGLCPTLCGTCAILWAHDRRAE